MDKRAIAQIRVGTASRGTGFLVSRDRLVVTALHVVADRKASKDQGKLMGWDGFLLPAPIDGKVRYRPGTTIALRFGDPRNPPIWEATAWVIDERAAPNGRRLYDWDDDWAVLGFDEPVPADVTPFELAALRDGKGRSWETFGFPDAQMDDGGVYPGTVLSWGTRDAELRSDAAQGTPLLGLSGGPCLVDEQVVALIHAAPLAGGVGLGGKIYGLHAHVIGAGAAGRVAVDPLEPKPFEADLILRVDRDAATEAVMKVFRDRVGQAAVALGVGHKPCVLHVVRAMVEHGVTPTSDALGTLDVAHDRRLEVIELVAAAQLPAGACAKLVTACQKRTTSLVLASDDAVSRWYTHRARHGLGKERWGFRLLHVDVAGIEEGAAGGGAQLAHIAAGVRPALAALLARLDEHVRALPPAQRTFWLRVLARTSTSECCIALRNETRVEVAQALRDHLDGVHVLMVHASPVTLPPTAAGAVETIEPHISDEAGLLAQVEDALAALG